jgi:hypothetical protein
VVVQRESEEAALVAAAVAVEVVVGIVVDSMPFPAGDRLQQPSVVGASYEVSGPIEPRELAKVVQQYTWVECHS